MDWQTVITPLAIVISVLLGVFSLYFMLKRELKNDLEPIQKQVDNHIPTDIKELRAEIQASELRTEKRILESENRIMNRMDALFKAYFKDKQ